MEIRLSRTADIVRVAAEEFGVSEKTVSEIVRRIREEGLFVRETRSRTKSPAASARHVAHLIIALMSGAPSRKAAEAVNRASHAEVDSYAIQKYWSASRNYILANEQWRRFFVDEDWSRTVGACSTQAPLRDFTDQAWRKRNHSFTFVDAIESLISAFQREAAIIHDFGASQLSYLPDLNRGVVEFVESVWDPEINGYMASDGNTHFEMEFTDGMNDFRPTIRRVVALEFPALARLAMSLSRANRDG